MAKIGSVSEENAELIETIVSKIGLDNYMAITPLSISKSKQLIRVQKANATTEYIGKCPDSVFLYIYEAAFDMLDRKTKILLIQNALNEINYDNEKDKISIGCQQIEVSYDCYKKYGIDLLNAMEAGIIAIRQISEEENNK